MKLRKNQDPPEKVLETHRIRELRLSLISQI